MIPKGSKVINEQGEEIGTMKRNKFNKGDRVVRAGVVHSVVSMVDDLVKIWDGYETYLVAEEDLKPYNEASATKTSNFLVRIGTPMQQLIDAAGGLPADTGKIKGDNPLDKQEGGSHYKDCKIEPVEYITANNLDFMQGNIVKYITRHKNKNGAEDIKKIKHYCDLILKLQYNE